MKTQDYNKNRAATEDRLVGQVNANLLRYSCTMPKRTAIDSYQLPLDPSYTNCGNAHSCPCSLPFNKPVPYHFLCGKLYFINLLIVTVNSIMHLLAASFLGWQYSAWCHVLSWMLHFYKITSHDHMMVFSAGLLPSSRFPSSLFPRALSRATIYY